MAKKIIGGDFVVRGASDWQTQSEKPMTTSLRKAEANRRNAQKSTGPRSTAGKGRARLNAMRHGIYASPAVLPGEDAGQHRAIIEGIYHQYQPEGPIEATIVNQIASAVIELNRLMR